MFPISWVMWLLGISEMVVLQTSVADWLSHLHYSAVHPAARCLAGVGAGSHLHLWASCEQTQCVSGFSWGYLRRLLAICNIFEIGLLLTLEFAVLPIVFLLTMYPPLFPAWWSYFVWGEGGLLQFGEWTRRLLRMSLALWMRDVKMTSAAAVQQEREVFFRRTCKFGFCGWLWSWKKATIMLYLLCCLLDRGQFQL